MADTRLVFTSSNVLLPGSDSCTPGTIVVDKATGKIAEIRSTHTSHADFPDISDENWIDAGDKWILPGLVEYAMGNSTIILIDG